MALTDFGRNIRSLANSLLSKTDIDDKLINTFKGGRGVGSRTDLGNVRRSAQDAFRTLRESPLTRPFVEPAANTFEKTKGIYETTGKFGMSVLRDFPRGLKRSQLAGEEMKTGSPVRYYPKKYSKEGGFEQFTYGKEPISGPMAVQEDVTNFLNKTFGTDMKFDPTDPKTRAFAPLIVMGATVWDISDFTPSKKGVDLLGEGAERFTKEFGQEGLEKAAKKGFLKDLLGEFGEKKVKKLLSGTLDDDTLKVMRGFIGSWDESSLGVKRLLMNELTDSGATISKVDDLPDGGFSLWSDKMKASITETPDQVKISGYYRNQDLPEFKGEPTRILNKIEEYAQNLGKEMEVVVRGTSESYWKKQGYDVVEGVARKVFDIPELPKKSLLQDVIDDAPPEIKNLAKQFETQADAGIKLAPPGGDTPANFLADSRVVTPYSEKIGKEAAEEIPLRGGSITQARDITKAAGGVGVQKTDDIFKDLKLYEKAMNSGNAESAEALMKKYPNDPRFKIHRNYGYMTSKLGPNQQGGINIAEGIESIKKKTTKLVKKFVEDKAPLKDFGDIVDGIPMKDHPYYRARLLPGSSAKAEGTIERVMKPILRGQGDNIDNFDEFLKLQRMKENLDQGFVQEFTKKEVTEKLLKMRESLGEAKWTNMWKSANEVYTKVFGKQLDELVDTGIISWQQRKALKSSGTKYVPFEIEEYMDNVLEGQFSGGSFNVAGQNLIKARKGSKKSVGSTLDATLRRMIKHQIAIDKNEAVKSLARLRFEPSEVVGGAGKAGFEIKHPFYDLITPVRSNVTGKDIISYMDKGKVKKFRVPEEIASVVKDLDRQSTNEAIRLMAIPADILKKGATGYDPRFLVRNFFRDLPDAIFGNFVEGGPKQGFRFLKNYPGAVRDSFKRSPDYIDWLESGAGGSTFISQELRKAPRTGINRLAGNRTVAQKLDPRNLMDFMNRVVEEAPRVATYKALRQGGADVTEAAFKSRTVTLDFASSGSSVRSFNKIIPYLNPRIQGSRRMVQLIKENPKRAAAMLAVMVGVPATATYLNNRKFKDYDDVSDFEKDKNWIWIWRDRTPEEIDAREKVKAIKVPKGNQLQIAAGMAENFMQYIDSRNPKGLDDMLLDSLEDFSPVGIPFGERRKERMAASLTPTAFQIPFEQITNKRLYTGAPIVPRYLEGVEKKEQFDESTPALAVGLGKLMNWSPKKIEALFSQVGANVGTQGLKTLSGDVLAFPRSIIESFSGVRGGKQQSEEFERKGEISKQQSTEKIRAERVLIEAIESGNPREVFSAAKKDGTLTEIGFNHVNDSKKTAKVISLHLSTMKNVEDKKAFLSQAKKTGVLTEEIFNEVSRLQDLDSIERSLKSAPVILRAQYISERLKEFETDEEKREYLAELKKKKILTKDVFDLLNKL